MKYVLAVAAALALTPAHAASTSIQTQCGGVGTYRHCNTTIKEIPDRVPQVMTKEEQDERDQRIDRWLAYCKPEPYVGRYGVTYLRYAHPDCDLGRDRD